MSLKPCPFCGSPAEKDFDWNDDGDRNYFVFCSNTNCSASQVAIDIQDWDKRYQPTCSSCRYYDWEFEDCNNENVNLNSENDVDIENCKPEFGCIHWMHKYNQ